MAFHVAWHEWNILIFFAHFLSLTYCRRVCDFSPRASWFNLCAMCAIGNVFKKEIKRKKKKKKKKNNEKKTIRKIKKLKMNKLKLKLKQN